MVQNFKKMEKFMQKYDEREELASRDIVARAIDNEMKISGDDYRFLDCREMDHEKFKEHFLIFIKNVWMKELILSTDDSGCSGMSLFMGGIETDMNGQSSIKNLFAVGECTNSDFTARIVWLQIPYWKVWFWT
jgi:L-aspartate oxidase